LQQEVADQSQEKFQRESNTHFILQNRF